MPRPEATARVASIFRGWLYGSRTVRGQGAREFVWMNDLGQAAQPIYQALARVLDDVDVNTVHLVQCERCDAIPVGALIYQRRIATEGRVFGQNDKLWICTDDGFIRDLWITTVTTVVMKDVDPVRVLQQLIAERTTAKDIGFARRAIVYFKQYLRTHAEIT